MNYYNHSWHVLALAVALRHAVLAAAIAAACKSLSRSTAFNLSNAVSKPRIQFPLSRMWRHTLLTLTKTCWGWSGSLANNWKQAACSPITISRVVTCWRSRWPEQQQNTSWGLEMFERCGHAGILFRYFLWQGRRGLDCWVMPCEAWDVWGVWSCWAVAGTMVQIQCALFFEFPVTRKRSTSILYVYIYIYTVPDSVHGHARASH